MFFKKILKYRASEIQTCKYIPQKNKLAWLCSAYARVLIKKNMFKHKTLSLPVSILQLGKDRMTADGFYFHNI